MSIDSNSITLKDGTVTVTVTGADTDKVVAAFGILYRIMPLTDSEIATVDTVLSELDKAKTKHRVFPADKAKGLAIIGEELGELAKAINDGEPPTRLIEEAAHTAVTAIRFIVEV